MLARSRCWERGCKHYNGAIQPDGTELTETHACAAFPEGIPDDIAYGENLHLDEVEGDHGITFERDFSVDVVSRITT